MMSRDSISIPQSAIRNPQSAIRNPQSAIRNPQSSHGSTVSPYLPDILCLQKEGIGRFLVNQQPDLLIASYDHVRSKHEFREASATDATDGTDGADED